MTTIRYRKARVGGCLSAEVEAFDNGEFRLRSTEALDVCPKRLTDPFEHWANVDPERLLVARRGADDEWVRVTYAHMLTRVKTLAAALLARGLSAERPVAILSGNSIEHLTLALAAAWAGIAHAPVSPAYSLVSKDFGKLRHVLGKLTPGLVFVDDAAAFAEAIDAAVDRDTEVIAVSGGGAGSRTPGGHPIGDFQAWLDEPVDPESARALTVAHEATGPETIVKFLFTSGSTRLPKSVITTNRMLCTNQQMLRQSLCFLADEPPVLVDWLPWNHVFGGSHNVGIVLYNGGSLYIDDGKPVVGHIDTTLKNLREISPSIYFNVPKGFEEIVRAMRNDRALAERFFANVNVFFYAGAALSQAVWDELDSLAEATVGERIPMLTGLGMTETAPSSTFAVRPGSKAGHIGLPCPGVEVRLVPVDGKTEIRFGGPHVMPGYWREPELTAAAFDDEGFYCTGDAVTWVDPENPQDGLLFDGRIAEDFKLASGTFVSVGPMRTKAILAGAPYVQDVVVTVPNGDDVGLLVFPRLDALSELAGRESKIDSLLTHPAVAAWFQRYVDGLWASGTGNASRVARLMVMTEPPSIDRGEVTDKGSFNQRAVLKHRADLVNHLHAASERVEPHIFLPKSDA